MGTSWSVVCTVNEPIALLRVFHQYYVNQGTAEIRYFVENPLMEGIEELRALPKARVEVCDEAFWRDVLRRQRFAEFDYRHLEYIQYAYRTLNTDFGLFCDADELFYFPAGIGAYLETIPRAIDSVLVKPVEAVYETSKPATGYFSTKFFRKPSGRLSPIKPKTWIRNLYLLFQRHGLNRYQEQGLWGHKDGKTIVRAKRPMFGITSHRFNPAARNAVLHESRSGYLLHFDCASADHWLRKIIARYGNMENYPEVGAARAQQFNEFGKRLAGADSEALRQLFEECHCLPEREIRRRMFLGLAVEISRLGM